jgi:outer membrane lipopolysaccharide assembly protein LptE/RlpB
LFYDGWSTVPAYYLVGSVQGDTPEQALEANIEQVTRQVRDLLSLNDSDVSDDQIQETIYVLRENALVSLQDVEGFRGR